MAAWDRVVAVETEEAYGLKMHLEHIIIMSWKLIGLLDISDKEKRSDKDQFLEQATE